MTFVFGALLSRLGFARSSFPNMWAFVIALSAFGLAVSSMNRPSVILLGLFLVPTLAFGYRSRVLGSAGTFAMLAASDASLALAISQRHAGLDAWSLPGSGGWEEGAVLIGLAALLRLAAPLRPPHSLFLVGWWQGLFLVWWSSTSAESLLAFGGVALIGAALLAPPRGNRGPLIAGGLAAIVGASGWTEALFPAGLAGGAFALGERAVASFILGAVPLSAVWAVAPSQLAWGIMPGVAVPLVFLAGLQGLVSSIPARWGGRIPALAGAIATVALLRAEGPLFLWAVYGLGLAAVVTALLTKPHSSVPAEMPPAVSEEPARPEVRLVAWLLLAGASLLWLRLVVIGMGTQFL